MLESTGSSKGHWRRSKKVAKSKRLRRKKGAKKELKVARKRREMPDEARMRAMSDECHMTSLRAKFLAQAKKYFGMPYARKYWTPEDAEYHSPLFLDCCGLVRKVLRDLRHDFGFRVGPWNQCYLYDTLPVTVEREQDLKPGDLVFISAIYNNPKSKIQKHNMTHVEIWLGEGVKTIGARWQKGKVQVFDSYMFDATAYHSPTYIFKSIDTWLMGVCRSHCPEHIWRMRSATFVPSSKSIFSLESQSSTDSRRYNNRQQQQQHPGADDENASGGSSVESDTEDGDNDRLVGEVSIQTQKLSLRGGSAALRCRPTLASLGRTRSLPVVLPPPPTDIRRSGSDDVIARQSITVAIHRASTLSSAPSDGGSLPSVSVL